MCVCTRANLSLPQTLTKLILTMVLDDFKVFKWASYVILRILYLEPKMNDFSQINLSYTSRNIRTLKHTKQHIRLVQITTYVL